MKFNNTTKIGLISLVSFFLLYWGVNYLKGRDIFSTKTTFFLKTSQAFGIANATPIFYKGIKVGDVSRIELGENLSDSVIITIDLASAYKMPYGTSAVVKSSLLGEKNIELSVIEGADYSKSLEENTFLPVKIEGGITDLIGPLGDKLTMTFDNLNKTITTINSALSEETIKDLQKTIANLGTITTKVNTLLSAEQHKISTMLSDLQFFASNLNDTTNGFAHTINNLNKISDDIAQSNLDSIINNIEQLSVELGTISRKVNNGEGTLGLLLNDKSMYSILDSTVNSANRLLIDLKSNPKRYVHFSLFGLNEKEKKKKK